MNGEINLTRDPLHASSKYLPVTYQTHIETLSRQPADTLKTTSGHSPDTLQTLKKHKKHSPDTLKIPPIHPLHQCVKKRLVAGGWFHNNNATLQAGTCQILSLAENPKWSWQQNCPNILYGRWYII